MADEGPVLLGDVVAAAADADPTARALVAPDGTASSWGALSADAAAVATLVDGRVDAGGRVAAVGANHPGWVSLYYGVPTAGRVLVPLNHRLAPAELAAQVARSGAEWVVGDDEQLARLAAAGVDASLLSGWDSLTARDTDASGAGPLPGLTSPAALVPSGDPQDPAWLLFTSGTTGTPKGAVLTHASLLAAVAASAGARPVDPDDVYLFCFPLCHVAGYNVLHRHVHGRPVVLAERFEPASFCQLVADHGVTSTSLAATMLASLCTHLDDHPAARSALTSLRVVAYGAAPMPPALLRRAHDLLDVDFTQGYGMTELSGNAVFLDAAAHRRGLDGDESLLSAAGWAAPGVEVRTCDPDSGAVVATGEVGEIEVRAPQVMAGYWDDPTATAATIRNGWLRTGDLGTLDDTGLLRVVDRAKDVIITGGENVSSREVEDVVLTAPGVAAVAVVGVADPTWGENVCAVVVPGVGEVVDPEEVVSVVRSRLAGFKTPRHVVVVDALPTNAAGKVVKVELRAWLAADPERVGPRR